MPPRRPQSDFERDTLLGLWAIPGVGPQTLNILRSHVPDGNLACLLNQEPSEWAGDMPLPPRLQARLFEASRPARIAERVKERCAEAGMEIALLGDEDYPERLADIPDAPPVLFHQGTVGTPRRSVAMVGSREIPVEVKNTAQKFARATAEVGVCIISGAAQGIDTACHFGALEARAVTWAFLGSALDTVDAYQEHLVGAILRHGGRVFSEYPPGVPADPTTFPQRNRLIAGAADAVLVLRARERSGTLHTVKAAKRYGRPVLAWAADVQDAWETQGCQQLLKSGDARLCDSPEDVWAAIGFSPDRNVRPAPAGHRFRIEDLAPAVQVVYAALHRKTESIDALMNQTGLDPAVLVSALVELELAGLAVQHPGKQYERV